MPNLTAGEENPESIGGGIVRWLFRSAPSVSSSPVSDSTSLRSKQSPCRLLRSRADGQFQLDLRVPNNHGWLNADVWRVGPAGCGRNLRRGKGGSQGSDS